MTAKAVDRCREWRQDRSDLAKCVGELERWRNIGSNLRVLGERVRTSRLLTPDSERILLEMVQDMPK